MSNGNIAGAGPGAALGNGPEFQIKGNANGMLAGANNHVVISEGGFKYDLSPCKDTGQPILFGQKGVSPTFSKKGYFNNAELDSVVSKIKSGEMKAADIEVKYIWVNGQKVVINNRSLSVLSKAGLKPVNIKDVSGKLPNEGLDGLKDVLERLDEIGGNPSISMKMRMDDDRNAPIKEEVKIVP
jgi:hypothetical protein